MICLKAATECVLRLEVVSAPRVDSARDCACSESSDWILERGVESTRMTGDVSSDCTLEKGGAVILEGLEKGGEGVSAPSTPRACARLLMTIFSMSLPLHRKMPVAMPKQYARAKSAATPPENVSAIVPSMMKLDNRSNLWARNIHFSGLFAEIAPLPGHHGICGVRKLTFLVNLRVFVSFFLDNLRFGPL